MQEEDLKDYINDSGWIKAELTENFKPYNDNTNNNPQYRKVGKIVEIVGIISPTKTIIGSATTIPIFYLPEGFHPHRNKYTICQGTGVNKWLLTVDGSGGVNFSRYGISDWADASTTVWLPFTFSFFID